MQVPERDGYYWAMWLVSDDGTDAKYDTTPSRIWETVELYTNDDAARRVYIPGVPGSQAADGFHWHPERLEPPPLKWTELAAGRTEEAARRYRSMTPDQREEFLQQARRRPA